MTLAGDGDAEKAKKTQLGDEWMWEIWKNMMTTFLAWVP